MVDDRGNVVDVYVNSERTGKINRESHGSIDGNTVHLFGFEGGIEEMKILIAENYTEDLAISLLCDLLIRENNSERNAKEFLKMFFSI